MFHQNSCRNLQLSLIMWNAKRTFINLHQQKHQSVQEYYESFFALKEVSKTLYTNIHDDLGFIEAISREKGEDPALLTKANKAEYMGQGCEQILAIHMLLGADQDWFASAIEDF